MKDAVLSTWECPSCGNIIRKQEVLETKAGGKKFTQPKSCGCGRKGSFKLIGFEERDYVIYNSAEVEPLLIPNEISEKVSAFAYNLLEEIKNENRKE